MTEPDRDEALDPRPFSIRADPGLLQQMAQAMADALIRAKQDADHERRPATEIASDETRRIREIVDARIADAMADQAMGLQMLAAAITVMVNVEPVAKQVTVQTGPVPADVFGKKLAARWGTVPKDFEF